jgi:SAM-dependent methyltransferase
LDRQHLEVCVNTPVFDRNSQAAPAVRHLIELADPAAADASMTVHADDDMYSFGLAISKFVPLSAMAYFRAGISINDTIRKLVDWRFGGFANIESILDFAAGYGRSTRFLVEHLRPDQVCVAEIQADALEFQAKEFGVATLQSTTDPADLLVPRQFDVVFVASLFTHLPAHTFGSWLHKLWQFVAAGGMLIFSVHDQEINEVGATLDDDGFAYLPTTEVASLSTIDYGANITTEAWVRDQIKTSIGPSEAAQALRLPRALCSHQDVWVICDADWPTEELQYECGPSGAVDQLSFAKGKMHLRGWAADLGFADGRAASHAIKDVRIFVNGNERALTRPTLDRPDVSAHLDRPDDDLLIRSGWEVSVRQPTPGPTDIVAVVATCEHGAQFVLDAENAIDLLERTGSAIPNRSRWRRRIRTARVLVKTQGVRVAAGRSLAFVGRATQDLGERVARHH